MYFPIRYKVASTSERNRSTTFSNRVTYCSLNQSCDRTIFYCPLLQGLATEMAAFVSFQLLCHRRVCFGMHSNVHFDYCRCWFHYRWPFSHLFRLVIARHGLSFAHFCFSRRPLPFRVTDAPSCRRHRHLILSSAFHSLTSASRSQGRLIVVPKSQTRAIQVSMISEVSE